MLLLSLSVLKHQSFRALLPAVTLCVLFPSPSQSAEWSLSGSVNQSLGYDTNVRMREEKQGSFEYKIIPELNFLHKTDVTEIKANASYGTQIYTDIENLNQDIQRYGLNGLYKTENIDWGLSGGYSVTPTRNTALQDTGDFESSSNNNSWSVSPFMTYRINETDSLNLTPSYTESSFTGSPSNFRNNNTINANLAWQHLWTEQYSSALSLFYSTYDSQGSSSQGGTQINFDSIGANFSNTYALSENWKLSGTIGLRHTESEANSVKSSSFGFLADTSVEYTGENFSSGINFSRSLKPSNQGQLQEQSRVGFDFSYKLAERLSASFNTSYQESTRINETDQGTRKNITVQPSINWQMTPDWTLTGSYRYRTQDRTQNNAASNITVDSNLFMLTINYNWQGLSISR